MQIMYITDVGFDTPNSNNHLVISMLKGFLDANHRVYLVQSHSTGKYLDVPLELNQYPNFYADTIKKPVVARKSFVKRYLNSIVYELKAWRKWKKHIKNVDVVVLQSHYTAVYTALLLHRYNKKIVFNIYDIFPGEAYKNGNIKSKFVFSFFAWIQRYLYKNCNKFFTLTEDTKSTLISLGVKKENIDIIPNWYDESAIHEVQWSDNVFAKDFNLNKEKKYIQYAGQIGVSYDFNLILNVAEKLIYRNDIMFQIVGEGLKLEELQARVQAEKLSNVEFIPWQPLDKLSDVYSSCTLQIVPLRSEVIKNSYPSKILPLMACSRVPVVSVESDTYFYNEINEHRVGVAVPIGDIDAVCNAILYIVDNESVRLEMQENARKFASERYTAQCNVKKMLFSFEKCIHEKKGNV